MDIARYVIHGEGPDGESFTEEIIGKESLTRSGLMRGEWSITAEAYNDDEEPVRIGTGSCTVVIQAGKDTNAEVTVSELSGTGDFSATVVWDDEELASPSLLLTLKDADDEEVLPTVTCEITGQQGIVCIQDLDTGYYGLEVMLCDEGSPIGFQRETLRIVKDQTTSGTISIITDKTGILSLMITQSMENPIAVSFPAAPEEFVYEETMTVTAETSADVDAYAWFVNGIRLIGESASSVTFGKDLKVGDYHLTCVVWKGSVTSSAAVPFTVLPTPITRQELLGMIAEDEDVTNVNTSEIADMSYLFYNKDEFNQDISGWNVSGVTNMSGMFQGASYFNQDISGWDVSSVTNMSGMFWYADIFNGDISGWDVSGVTNMSGMFWYAVFFNGDISGWDVSSVEDMSYMFWGASHFNQDISGWDVSSVTNHTGFSGEECQLISAFHPDESWNGE
jgi:surface protein